MATKHRSLDCCALKASAEIEASRQRSERYISDVGSYFSVPLIGLAQHSTAPLHSLSSRVIKIRRRRIALFRMDHPYRQANLDFVAL